MTSKLTEQSRKIYAVINPVAGHSSAQEIVEKLEALCSSQQWEFEIYETTGKENIASLTQDACRNGANLVIAAGGDGTVSGVVNGLIGTGIPLGILPVGTGNGLARALGIPLDLDAALELLSRPHEKENIDAMQVGDKYFVLNVSAGLSAEAMKRTEPEQKRRWGILAYIRNFVAGLIEKPAGIFRLDLDNFKLRVQATEVLISNAEILQSPLDFFGERSKYIDGRLEVNILTATNTREYARLAWNMLVDQENPNPEIADLSVHEKIIIQTDGKPQPVQGDGELFGHTPVEVKLVRGAVQVIVPEVEASKTT